MTIADVASANIGGMVAVSVVGLMSLVQVSRIQINPWSWIARKFGNAINHDISGKIDDLDKRIDDVEKLIGEVQETQENDRKAVERNNAITSRVRVLGFNEEILRGERHSKESYDQILSDISDYRHYCAENPTFENDRAILAIQNIERCYQKHLTDRDFL